MTEGGKDAIKKTGDHNWHMERMQFEKERGNISDEKDIVSSKIRAAKVQEVMGTNKTDELSTISNQIAMPYKKGQKARERNES